MPEDLGIEPLFSIFMNILNYENDESNDILNIKLHTLNCINSILNLNS